MPADPPPRPQDGALLAQAREKLREQPPRPPHWGALAAAALFAVCAIVFATAAVLSPPLSRDPAAKTSAP